MFVYNTFFKHSQQEWHNLLGWTYIQYVMVMKVMVCLMKPNIMIQFDFFFLRLCLSVCCAERDLDATELLSPALSSSARWEWV